MANKDYYKIMGLDKNASQEDIKRTYRKLARKYHPDVNKSSDAEEKFKELGEAYEVLKDPEKRAQYDQYGDQWQNASFHAGGGPQYEGGDPFQGANFDFDDILGSIFGKSRQGHHRSVYDGGQDIHAKLAISLEESYQGAQKTIQLQVPTMGNHGEVTHELKTIKVTIPKGITDKKQIRLKGQGGQIDARQRGDLYVEIQLAPHKIYRVDDKDIHLELPISPWEAALGAEVTVPTLGGPVKLKIPKLSQTGTKMRLKGKGLPGRVAGNQFVHLQIVIPQEESPEATALFKQLAETVRFNPRAKLGCAS